MTPEGRAREQIDERLRQAGWLVQDWQHINPVAGIGIAVRQYPTDSGTADYMLLVNRAPLGVIKATHKKAPVKHHRREASISVLHQA